VPEESGRHEQIGVSLAGLDRFVSRCVGYRHEGLDPGTHLGLPGTSVTLVLSLDEPTFVGGISSIDDPPVAFDALLGGLYSRPVQIVYGQRLHGIQLDLTPRGVRSLLGIPASELSETVIDLQTLMGPAALELSERLREIPDWDSRFELLGRTLHRRPAELGGPSSALEGAWGRILTSGGGVRIAQAARADHPLRTLPQAARERSENDARPCRRVLRLLRPSPHGARLEGARGLLADELDGTRRAPIHTRRTGAVEVILSA
jgi:hypothetical protein